MKKIIAAALAAAMLVGMNVSAFAATTSPVRLPVANLTGQPISEDGFQYKDGDSIPPNQTLYYLIPSAAAQQLNNTRTAKLTVRKNKNAKLVKSVTLVEKRLTSNSNITAEVPFWNTTTNAVELKKVPLRDRNTYIAVELNEITGEDEYKIDMEFTFTGRTSTASNYKPFFLKDASNVVTGGTNKNEFQFGKSGDKLTLTSGIFVSNPIEDGDGAAVTVGKKGMTIKPIKNSDNEIVFDNDSDTLATLTFTASSNPKSFYAKLSTNWTNTLLTKFKNTDAVIRRFSAASIDSTSRGVLALNNPFDPDDYDIDRVYIYAVDANNKITNVTNQFSYNEDDDTFDTKTRTLGTYIISDVKIKI